MFTATLTRKNDRNSPYVAKLEPVRGYKRNGEPTTKYKWTDFVSRNGGRTGGYELFPREYSSESSACKAALKNKNIRIDID